jgi:hypothetical protein
MGPDAPAPAITLRSVVNTFARTLSAFQVRPNMNGTFIQAFSVVGWVPDFSSVRRDFSSVGSDFSSVRPNIYLICGICEQGNHRVVIATDEKSLLIDEKWAAGLAQTQRNAHLSGSPPSPARPAAALHPRRAGGMSAWPGRRSRVNDQARWADGARGGWCAGRMVRGADGAVEGGAGG